MQKKKKTFVYFAKVNLLNTFYQSVYKSFYQRERLLSLEEYTSYVIFVKLSLEITQILLLE